MHAACSKPSTHGSHRASRSRSGDVDGAIEEGALQGTLFPKEVVNERLVFDEIRTRKRGAVKARTVAQDLYLRALKKYELVFAEGPAGTGKTWLAVGHGGVAARTRRRGALDPVTPCGGSR